MMAFERQDNTPTYVNFQIRKELAKGDMLRGDYIYTEQEPRTMQQQTQYRDPPPYPGHSKQMYTQQSGLRQSFSGSETSTDVSVSSMENLSTTQRQEPQGEETHTPTQQNYHQPEFSEMGYSILERLGMPKTAMDFIPSTNQPYYNMSGHPQHCIPYPTDPNGYLNCPSCSVSQWQTNPSTFSGICTGMKNSSVSSENVTTFSNAPIYSSPSWNIEHSPNQLQSSYFTTLPPPPEYPGTKANELRRSYETVERTDMTTCRSQPDLSRYMEAHNKQSHHGSGHLLSVERDHTNFGTRLPVQNVLLPEMDDCSVLTASTGKMLNILTDENKKLREDLNNYHRKVAILQKFELEIKKVHEDYESLVQSSRKREKLENMRKKRYEEEIKKLYLSNKQLQEKVASDTSLDGKSEKEVQTTQKNYEMEIVSLKGEVTEWKDKNGILDDALTNAQANVVHLEKECCKKQVQMERLENLQKAFSSLQAACSKREQMEKQLRTRLEKENETLKQQIKGKDPKTIEKKSDEILDTTNLSSLQRLLNEKDAKILELKTEVIKWEQKYLEENALRQFSLQNMYSSSSDSINTMELENEKREKLHQMEEIIYNKQQMQDLEAKVKALQTQLAEKDAMIRVFQRSPMMRSSSVHTLSCSPQHSPRPSMTSSLSRQFDMPSSIYATIRHNKTGSTSALETGRAMSLDDDLKDKFDSIHLENKDDSSEEEGEKVWQV
ncbi:unnamed protein product [Mytilus edulis]|uniref:Angiomotin C-terminal domain-containing protein n=1 Tax=Mytilus edulis TaxID=6550 RepID=A0A8S3RUA8_MYTED|nr:unnamed protein product [Mytilus edulis]